MVRISLTGSSPVAREGSDRGTIAGSSQARAHDTRLDGRTLYGDPDQSSRAAVRQASKAASSWGNESPPNFSRKAEASSSATTASPTTLAAGTEVTSDRW